KTRRVINPVSTVLLIKKLGATPTLKGVPLIRGRQHTFASSIMLLESKGLKPGKDFEMPAKKPRGL
ncbi:hypothetical protein HZB88_00415, partial [archaeon]|nr:hypothetical protein [archaeon]